MICPCNPDNSYKECCAIAHKDINAVNTAEQLMRSRYSAFALGNTDYLTISHHSSQQPTKKEMRELRNWTNSVTWVKLVIRQASNGLKNDSTGTVEFEAYYLENGSMKVIKEHSRFCKENRHWVYLDAII